MQKNAIQLQNSSVLLAVILYSVVVCGITQFAIYISIANIYAFCSQIADFLLNEWFFLQIANCNCNLQLNTFQQGKLLTVLSCKF